MMLRFAVPVRPGTFFVDEPNDAAGVKGYSWGGRFVAACNGLN